MDRSMNYLDFWKEVANNIGANMCTSEENARLSATCCNKQIFINLKLASFLPMTQIKLFVIILTTFIPNIQGYNI